MQEKFLPFPKTSGIKAGAGRKPHLLGDGQLCPMGSLMSHCFLNSEKPNTIVLM